MESIALITNTIQVTNVKTTESVDLEQYSACESVALLHIEGMYINAPTPTDPEDKSKYANVWSIAFDCT